MAEIHFVVLGSLLSGLAVQSTVLPLTMESKSSPRIVERFGTTAPFPPRVGVDVAGGEELPPPLAPLWMQELKASMHVRTFSAVT
ncbi:hypothetical protein I547_6150 [Mycobacterium kansasii 824]|uniref:Uncharacterized protein n=1 Tax=Mycobacterium kansasii TaxID=1768 RepID=A0A1V3WVF0_MYCKA|nr:hypothetical protein I547_6150 [Mycobacterium kansasii 824]OOK70301.1 hypothetical protein BZL30_6411 [Mycobacterium kansasii]OOK74485.1 hypothetical protein BZL29_4432 [Mycobacterium kansasii]